MLATEGRFVTTLRLGMRPGAWRAVTGENDYVYSTRGVQLRLAALGYLDRRDVTDETDYLTEQALLAFQGWEDLDRTGTVTGQTQLALFRAQRPRPAARRQGRRVEIYRDLGVLLMVEDGEVRVVHTSTGAGGLTPVGDFSVYAKVLLVVGAVPGVDALRRLLPRRDRDAPVARRSVLPRLTRLRASPGEGGRACLPLRRRRYTGSSSLTRGYGGAPMAATSTSTPISETGDSWTARTNRPDFGEAARRRLDVEACARGTLPAGCDETGPETLS